MGVQMTAAEQLAGTLEERATELVEQSVRAMYLNSFWDARFGERGHELALQDGHFHIKFLAGALRVEQPELVAQYARWLQGLLTVRGMCSRHVAENFQRLGDAMRELRIEQADLAVQYLQQAEDALLYPEGAARAIQDASADLAARIAQDLAAGHPDWYEQWRTGSHERCRDDVSYHLSYLADAVALAKAELFAAYVGWIASFLARYDVPIEHVVETLLALERALQTLPDDVAQVACPVVAAAREGLRAGTT